MRFKLTILGCSSALPTISKYQSAHVLNIREQLYLIDCGEGVQKQLKRYDINILKINHIFISHLHGDHTYGLFGLISTMGLLGRDRVLEIFAPAPISEIVANHINFFDKWLSYKIVCHTLDAKRCGVIYENNFLTVETLPLKHSIEAVGFLFKEKTPKLNIIKSEIDRLDISLAEIAYLKDGEDVLRASGERIRAEEVTYSPYFPRSFAYCCDTGYTERFLDKIMGVDMLLHETTYLEKDRASARKRFHSTTHDAGIIAKKAGVKQLVISHFSSRYKCSTEKFLEETIEVFENSLLGREGAEYEIAVKQNIVE